MIKLENNNNNISMESVSIVNILWRGLETTIRVGVDE